MKTKIGIIVNAAVFAMVFISATLFNAPKSVSAEQREQLDAIAPLASTLLISEFRLRGPNGATDEFIEIYNNSLVDHVVTASTGSGYGVAASDGSLRCTIPNNTVISGRGHYLCANNNVSGGYSLSSYASPDATYTLDIPDNMGIALFNTTLAPGRTLANRFDAVGSASEANTLYKEGAGYPVLIATNLNYSLFRKYDRGTGYPIDADNNVTDFLFADTNGVSIGAGQRLGAPGPEKTTSPWYTHQILVPTNLLDSTKAASISPNRIRDFTPDAANNSPFGTLSIRRRFVNNTGANLTRLRFRITDISTYPSPFDVADLRPRSAGLVVIAGINDIATCAATGSPATPPCTVSVQGVTLDSPPTQPNGGGFNSSLSAGTVTIGTPVANGASINLQFLMGVAANGPYHLAIEIEGLPGAGGKFEVSGNTLATSIVTDTLNRVADFDGDSKTDLSIFRPNGANGAEWWISKSGGGNFATQFGAATDKIVPADYTGDGKTDVAFWRPSTGFWFVLRSEDLSFFAVPFGTNGDVPVPADFDADGKADIAVFRPSNSTWFISNTTGGTTIQQFGLNGDVPVAADYDGDGNADIAIYRPSLGQWWLNRSTAGTVAFQFGTSTDKTVVGDHTGDGKADVAFWRPSTGQWFVLRSENNSFFAFPFGISTDLPVPGDYDADGKTDAAIFRPSNSTWFIQRSTAGTLIQQFGIAGDQALPNAFVR